MSLKPFESQNIEEDEDSGSNTNEEEISSYNGEEVDEVISLDDQSENPPKELIEVKNVPTTLRYGKNYVVEVEPPEADIDVTLYYVDRNENPIEKNKGSVIGIPAWNTRLAKNFPEGRYRIDVKVSENIVKVQDLELFEPEHGRYRNSKHKP